MITGSNCGKSHKRVVIHVPMKVKHHHHVHTVYKPVHHELPVELEEHEYHVGKPHHEDFEDDYHFGNGRMVDHSSSYIKNLHSSFPYFHNSNDEEDDEDHEDQYHNFERQLKKRSKSKQNVFSNRVIGWKGRPSFDKIASEYLLNIKNHPQPEFDDYDDRYSPYADDDSRRKRK